MSMKIVPKIDIHSHSTPEPLTWRSNGQTFCTPPELRHIYDQLGVEKAVLLPPPREISSREARNMVRDFPDTFGWWFCNFDPITEINDPEADLSRDMESYKAAGAKGIGEIVWNLPFDDPNILNLFRHAERCDMPVLFHIGDRGKDYGLIDELGLPRLEKVLGMFPGLKFIGHSQKFWSEIGECDEASRGGYPTGKVTPGRVVELMGKYPNLYADISAGSGANALLRDPEFAYGFLEEFQDRILFGLDICAPQNSGLRIRQGVFLDDAMQQGKISYGAYEKICRGNALDLLET